MKNEFNFPALMVFLLFCGCSSESYKTADQSFTSINSAEIPAAIRDPAYAGMPRMGTGRQGKSDSDSPQASQANRKIIYSADLSIVVEEFDLVESSVTGLVKKFGGFIADANIDTQNRKSRRGEWKVRIPISKFEPFLSETGSLGVVVSRSQQAQDVTDEYVDVKARISNKKKLEARILELLERPDDKIQHVIEVEKELGRVREEIERMEGRMRYLNDKIELTTVKLSIREEKEYRPAAQPSFSGRIAKAWNSSMTRTQRFFEDTAVWLVGNALPIVFCSSIGVAAFVVVRRKLKSRDVCSGEH